MPKAAATVAFLLLCGAIRAQEPIPADHAQKVGKQLEEVAKQVDGVQLQTEVDPDKAAGIYANQRGALAIPSRDVSEERLNRAEEKVVPLGHLWLRGIAPVVGGQVAARDRLRPMKVTVDDKEHELFFFLLGASKKDSGEWELLVYGKDKEPLVRLPLKKSGAGAQELPIQLDGKKNDDDTGALTVKLLGKLEAVITVGESPES